MSGNPPPGVPENLITPQGNMPAIGIPNSQDYPRLVFSAPRFETVAIADIIQPSVTEAVEAVLPSLIPPYVDAAVLAGVQQYAVLLTGSTMTGPLFLNPLMPTADAQAATKAYVDAMVATAGVPEVPPVPVGQTWARQTGQWVPVDESGGTFLPLSGGTMQGIINMSGNTITNMAAVPAMPNGAAPAQWVLNQIASVSLFQGQWNADTNTPDLTQLSVRVNGYTWIAITSSIDGVVIGPAIPGLQGSTIYNGDTVIYSTVDGAFFSIHAGGLSLPEADARYVQLAGSQMSGALLLNANASQNLQAVTLQQLDAAVANTVTPDAPADGQGYLRVGVGTTRWVPGLPLAGGILTGTLTLSGPGASGNQAVTVTQLNSAISAAQAGFMPIAGGTFTGAVILNGNASSNLNPVPLQQVNAMLGTYAPLQNPALSGVPTAPTATPASTNTTQLATCAFTQSAINAALPAALAGYLPLAGGTLTGALHGTTASFSGAITGTAVGNVIGGVTLQSNNINIPGSTATGTLTSSGGVTLASGSLGGVTFPGGSAIAATGNGSQIAGVQFPGGGALQGTTASFGGNVTITGGQSLIPAGDDQGFVGVGGLAFVQCTAYAFANMSDPRSKRDIEPAPGALAEVMQIPVHTFRLPHDADAAPKHWGFLSTHVREVMGDGFGGWSEGEDEAKSQSLSLSDMIAVLWAAVQELAAKVPA